MYKTYTALQDLDHESAVNCDNLFTLPKNILTRRRGRLGTAKLTQLDRALVIALGLYWSKNAVTSGPLNSGVRRHGLDLRP